MQMHLISAWINNCVGHKNHVYFVRFLAFAVAGCLHALVMLGIILYYTLTEVRSLHVGQLLS